MLDFYAKACKSIHRDHFNPNVRFSVDLRIKCSLRAEVHPSCHIAAVAIIKLNAF